MAGYKDLLVYRLAVTIFDLTNLFCHHWIDKRSRTFDQMVQASRSGKQNIAEASKEISSSSQILLNSTSRASYTELGEDFEDFLRQRNLPVWPKDDPRVLKIRAFRESVSQPTNLANLANWTNLSFEEPENFANLMLCLCFKQGYLMDQLLRSLEGKFIKEGGFRENLFRKRQEYRQQI
mgnify:CR=1 FL=1